MTDLQLSDGVVTPEFDNPVYPYTTTISFPFDIVELENGKFAAFDNGSGAETYDKRICRCTFELDATDTASLVNIITTAAQGRGEDLTLTPGDGFFPFGHDKGDDGPFSVIARIIEGPTETESPYKHFKTEIEFVNTGSWPAYTLPTQINDGVLQIGTVQNLRFPPQWFDPRSRFGVYSTIEEDATSQYIDRGETHSDSFITSWSQFLNNSKCAALLEYLTGTARTGTFSVIAASDFYMFGERKGGAGTYVVRLIQSELIVTHNRFNEFTLPLTVSWESTS